MRVASKTATTTAPNAAECQSFLDNLIAVFAVVRLLNDLLNSALANLIWPPQISELMKVEECQAKFDMLRTPRFSARNITVNPNGTILLRYKLK